jgi:RNA polymerase sigma-70 factor (ECF subfamily)
MEALSVLVGGRDMVVVPLPDSSVVDEDTVLVARAQRDQQDFALLYRHYLPQVYRYCYRRLGSREAAEDATSQVFTHALAALARFEDRGGSFRSWLFTITHNIVTDEGRRTRPSLPLDAAGAVAASAPEPDEEVIRAEERQTLAALLLQLPPPQRQVLELRMAGLTGVEIAAVLGRSLGAIRKLQYRTLLRLRDMLEVTGAQMKEARDAS